MQIAKRSLIKSACLFSSIFVLTLAGASCSSDDTKDNTGGSSGSGGSTGGKGGAGGSTTGGTGGGTTGGTGGGGDAGDPYTCQKQPPVDPGGTAEAGADCCGGLGKCVAETAVNETQRAGLGLDDCKAGANLKCAPPQALADAGTAPAPVTCASTGDIEGRCVPKCFVLGNKASANLPQATCPADQICAPCYSPLDAKLTGACNSGTDAPVDPAPTPFAECGPTGGLCVPAEAAGGQALQQLTCAAGDVCAPTSKVADPSSCFAKCTSTTPLGQSEGGCVPIWVVPADQQALIDQGSCTADELCAPCINPLDMKETGACQPTAGGGAGDGGP